MLSLKYSFHNPIYMFFYQWSHIFTLYQTYSIIRDRTLSLGRFVVILLLYNLSITYFLFLFIELWFVNMM